MKRRFFQLIATLAVINFFTMSCFAKDFIDMSLSHWASKEIQTLEKDNIIVGYPDGSFKPDQPATRAEFATMAVKALRQDRSHPGEMFYFSDLTDAHWAYNNIQRACAFDLIKGFPDNTFKPEDNISKAEAVAMMISAVNTQDLTLIQAKDILKVYNDADKIPDWAILAAAKSEKLGITRHIPQTYDIFDPDKKITRAEIAADLYQMKEQAKIHPNFKLAPKKGEGIVLDNVSVDGTIATIPKGTKLSVMLSTPLNSQTDDKGQVLTAAFNDTYITKEKYLLIPKGSNISGEIVEIKPGRYFIRNAKMKLNSNYILISYQPKAEFPGNISSEQKKYGFFASLVNFVIKGRKINLAKGNVVTIELTKPISIDLTNTAITNN